MMLKFASAAIALVASLAPPAMAASRRQTPDFRVQVFGEISAEFTARMRTYADLRRDLERDLPPHRVTADAAEILGRVRALAKRIRAARADARQGDIFTPAVGAEFKKALQTQSDPLVCAAIRDENPGALSIGINGNYPEHAPLSTTPPSVLAALPRLPDDVEYRFAGRQLLLFDTRARLVVDRLPAAIECGKSPGS